MPLNGWFSFMRSSRAKGRTLRLKAAKRRCILCSAGVAPSTFDKLFLHPKSDKCRVVITDHLGISVDDEYEFADGQIWARAEAAATSTVPVEFGGAIFMTDDQGSVIGAAPGPAFLAADAGAKRLFETIGKPFLGGSSGPKGWSSVSTFQRCPYLWQDKYGSKTSVLGEQPGSKALEVGSLLHLFLAVHYSQMIDPLYPLDPEAARRFLELVPVTPEYLSDAWNLFTGYRLWWGDERTWMTPLAVEELAVDPRTGFSCRWDLVFRVDQPYENLLPGVYVADHKSASQGGQITMERWKNDGQILGEIDLYERLGYHRKWGGLRGACINLIIKTKSPQYLRSYVYPSKGVLRDHRKSLAIWSAAMDTAAATGVYPRSRAACITQYRTFCELHDHCSGADGQGEREIEQ